MREMNEKSAQIERMHYFLYLIQRCNENPSNPTIVFELFKYIYSTIHLLLDGINDHERDKLVHSIEERARHTLGRGEWGNEIVEICIRANDCTRCAYMTHVSNMVG